MERKKNVAEIKRLIKERQASENRYHALVRFLTSKGVSETISQQITQDFARAGGEMRSLQESIVKRIHTVEARPLPERLALVGPTGVGKTTTVLKLADLYRKEGRKVAIVSLDTEKGGAYAQLEKYTSAWEIPLHTEIEKADAELTLIDTTGCNFYQESRVDALGELLATCGEIEIVLTLSAAAREVDLYGAIHRFSPLCPTSLAFTKLDETLASGVLINISAKTDLPIRYIAHGYPLPGEIEVADPYKITHKILTQFNNKEFNYLRQLTSN